MVFVSGMRGDMKQAGDRLQHYRIVKALSGGVMSPVYLALDEDLDRYVVLKFMPRDGNDAPVRFAQELQALTKLQPPHVVPIYGRGIDPLDGPRMAMRFVVHGQDAGLPQSLNLLQRLAQPLDIGPGLTILRQVASALDAVHLKGIVHRDVKPANVFLDEFGNAWLGDFGIVKAGHALTSGGKVLGTPAYMSPEQCLGNALDGRSDLYALAVMAYRWLAGAEPFQGEQMPVMFAHVYTAMPEAPLQAHPAVIPVLRKALAKSPQDRHGTARELVDALESALRGRGAVTMPAAEVPKPQPTPKSTIALSADPAWASATGRDSYGDWAEIRVKSVIQRLRWIKPGVFSMGAPDREEGLSHERPRHRVTISRGFLARRYGMHAGLLAGAHGRGKSQPLSRRSQSAGRNGELG